MKECPDRCKGCIFVQNNPYDTQWECYNPLCDMMDTHNEGKCDYRITEDELCESYKAKNLPIVFEKWLPYREKCGTLKWNHYCINYENGKETSFYINGIDIEIYLKGDSMSEESTSNKSTSTWTKASPCRFVDDNGYCTCEHLVESIRRSMNITQLEHECLFVGLWGEARVICMGYEKKQQRFEVHNKSDATLLGIFDSRERAEKFVRERIEIVEVE